MSESCAGCLHPLIDHDRAGCELCECARPRGRKPTEDFRQGAGEKEKDA